MTERHTKALVYLGCGARFLFILAYYMLITGVIRIRFEDQPGYWPLELFVAFFFLYSTARMATFGDHSLRGRMEAVDLRDASHRTMLSFLGSDIETRIELIVMIVVLFVFPIDFGICSLGVLLGGIPYYLLRRAVVVLCALPPVLLAYYFGRRSAIDHLSSLAPRERGEGKGFFRQVLLYIALGFFYVLSTQTIVAMLGVAATTIGVFLAVPLFAFWLFIAASILFFFKSIRVLRARRRLSKRLRRICREKRYRLHGPHRLYRSFFRLCEGPHFTVEIGREVYDCRVYSTGGRMKQVSVDSDGYVTATPVRGAASITRWGSFVQLFTLPYSVRTPYSFESKYRKILIITPSVLRWFVSDEHGTRNADVGTNAFGYKLYNAETFLGLLDRDALGDDYMRK